MSLLKGQLRVRAASCVLRCSNSDAGTYTSAACPLGAAGKRAAITAQKRWTPTLSSEEGDMMGGVWVDGEGEEWT